MFFLFALLSLLGYSLQSTLLAHQARQMDGLSLAFYRNLSLCFSMTPLLFLVNPNAFENISSFLLPITFAALTGTLALATGLQSAQYMPVGIITGLKVSIMTITALILGFFFFGESLSWIQAFLVLGVISCVLFLSFQKYNFPHFTSDTFRGFIFCFLSGILTALSGFFMSQSARNVDPFLSGYGWEVGIFIFSAIFVLLRWIFTKQPLKRISVRDFSIIAAFSSLTLLGTGALAYAVTLGPFGLLTTIGAGGILVSSFFAFFLYDEKFTIKQWGFLALLFLFILGLRFTSI